MLRRSKPEVSTPLDGVDVVIADLDGVVYKGELPIIHAVESLNRAALTRRVGYITNNASRTTEVVAEQLRTLGLGAVADDVVSSPQAAVALLSTMIPAHSIVLVIGGEGLVSEIAAAGFAVTASADDRPAAVVQGFHPSVGWTQLAEAAFALENEQIPWIATNQDWTIPLARGIAPGNGTLVSAVHTAAGILPTVAGKPERAIFDTAVARFGAVSPLMIGDRLDTDIVGANRAGIPTAQVLTGVDGARQLLAAGPDERPTYILDDLRGLHEEYPKVQVRGSSYQVRDAIVRLAGDTIIIDQVGLNHTDLLRAGTSLIWESGRQIYGFYVPEALYA